MFKSIHIRNFKSLRDVSVNLAPLTVLIGRSGTGKSNFVQAIRFLRDYLTYRSLDFLGGSGGWAPVFCATGATSHDKVSFELCFDVPGFSGRFSYTLAFPSRGGAADVEALAVDSRVVFEQRQGKWTQPPKIAEPPQPATPALGTLYGIPEAKVAHLALTRGIGCYDFPGSVLWGGQFDPAQGTPLDDSASNYLTAFDAIANELSQLGTIQEIVAALRQLNGSLVNVELALDRSHIVVSHRLGEGRVLSFGLSQESEGMRRFLAHLLALYQRPPKQVLIFEEPEKGIYPGALAVLADYFRSVGEKGQSQIILTTHSPELLRHFGPDHIQVVEMENGETKIGRLAPEQRESLEEHLLTSDELLTVDEARIDPAVARM